MVYRTKTYLAGDWTGDKNAIDKIHEWNNSDYYSQLTFVDVHEFIQARDTSLPCTIKDTLRERMKMCKTFVLIVGEHTNKLTKGSCRLCQDCFSICDCCLCKRRHTIDDRSYVDYECEQAIKQELRIVVLYNSVRINKDLCPTVLKSKGKHVAMRNNDCPLSWNYSGVRDAILGM